MIIEFKKVPTTKKELITSYDSVKLEGTFCRISHSLVEVESKLTGCIDVDCYRCGTTFNKELDEEFNFFINDGIYSGDIEDLVIEVENHNIDFDEIIDSELSSIKSDYHLCEECLDNDEIVNKEY